MTEREIAKAQYILTKELLQHYCTTIDKYLPEQNGKIAGSRYKIMAFDFLERIYYNSKGALLLYDEYADSQNIAIPLSQIFRAILYDITHAYWLLEDGFFDERFKLFNYGFVYKKGCNPNCRCVFVTYSRFVNHVSLSFAGLCVIAAVVKPVPGVPA
ncbi:hypothetical protein, partial [Hymenobacter elongatus]|uniref:hypothetical protein n=1 Tax=Hymenobacter elongatus TaxID=877208 RepID=UPI001AEC09E6